MDNEGTMIIPIIGYILAILIPIVGLVYGTAIFYLKKDVPLYRKHGRYIIYCAIIVFVVSLIVRLILGL